MYIIFTSLCFVTGMKRCSMHSKRQKKLALALKEMLSMANNLPL